MHLTNESIIVILVVGLIAGWLAGKIVRGSGFGLIGDIAIGIIGAFIGEWLLPRLGVHLGSGTISLIVNATLGAIVLLLIIRLVSGGGRLGGGWRGRSGRWR
ncbi:MULTISPECIES: GlsB/YeaQ/YmgE family stress response membrane protein [unclassified Mesorhizobium]|uniref:GlsB/YeaQ/YmgE family stress response membrane protein n=2 Tax=Mesorhizobium TaxID=68287 RepID=UPI000FCA60FB|nr:MULTISPECIES: GlsB/YeaQ/YmgE family stress response membrane protein [unclassified Mesorhizobium]RUX71942.1 GlsB/YeaQ/YmgE family stress response membrane protein [Mesorhizobium sp. M7A.F.Ca.US.005.03.1.1]RUY14541.1 GlsB/YeaQ/YmgE family stress response membrane protein [Mesorhizobium sp. M7A.F.Ca.US.005.03.2.1]RUY34341.1 GlsB/YeaQ/YmgE family stress response membrane protein [Mesorhizobium sp. M7A.F.Ca.US.001.04.1.1]RUY95211.1 GlsB/YeaQ/YmgE family stress response membrane protein [Mesorhiz